MTKTIYLAGGCFWGTQRLMQAVSGVTATVCGYANGTGEADAHYGAVCTGRTGFRECVEVQYAPEQVSLDALLFLFFRSINPTYKDMQGADRGSQYQAGIYWTDTGTESDVRRVAAIEAERYQPFQVELKPLQNFFPAEEAHQDYLVKHPGGYCHVSPALIRQAGAMRIDPGRYRRQGKPDALLSAPAALPAGGFYADAATGEPLFAQADALKSDSDALAFSRPLEELVLVRLQDGTFDERTGIFNVELRSRAGNRHIGYVFEDDPASPTGLRYAVSREAVRFIPAPRAE